MTRKKKTYQVHTKEDKPDIVVKIDQFTGLRVPHRPTKVQKSKKQYTRKEKYRKRWK